MLIVTELHYHRNGVGGAGYYAGRAKWRVGRNTFRVMFVVFDADEHIAIMGDGGLWNGDLSMSYRCEDFERPLREFIESRGGQALAFPHTICA